MRIKSQKDFFAGLMFSSIGLAFAIASYTSYKIGTAARMGPAYFPIMLGVLLAVLGAFIIFEALVIETEDGEPVGEIAWKPLTFVILANLLFGVMIGGLPSIKLPAMGLIAGVYVLTFVGSLAGDRFKPKEVFILATSLAVVCYLAFIKLLNLQFPVWPTFITG